MPKSLIERLPVHLRTPALRKMSANANAPGGSQKQTGGRPSRAAAQAAQRLGIILIEVVPQGGLVVKVGATNRNVGSGLTDPTVGITGIGATGSPATITTSEQETFTYAAGGVKDISAVVTGDVTATGHARVAV